MSGYEESSPLLVNDQQQEYEPSIYSKLVKKLTPEHEWRYYFQWKNWVVVILMIAVIICGTANRVLFTKMLYVMTQYGFFLNEVTSFIYMPVFWPIVWIQMYTGSIPHEMRQFPLWKFIIMGACDATAGLLMMVGATQVEGPLQLLLTQMAIPLTMICTYLVASDLLSFIFHKVLTVRYQWTHIFGACVLMLGVFIALLGSFLQPSDNENVNTTLIGIILFTSSTIPMAFSGVYKEIAFKGCDLGVNYVNAWVATWQFIFGSLFLPLVPLPAFGGIPYKQLPTYFWNAIECTLGVPTNTTMNTSGTITYNITSTCDYAYFDVAGYLFINILYNVVLLFMLKFGSAALFYIASAVILPCADICFSSKLIMGAQYATPPSIYDWAGLVVILIGLVLYRLRAEQGAAKTVIGESGEPVEVERVVLIRPGQFEVVYTAERVVVHRPRTAKNIRLHYLSRLGLHEIPDEETGELGPK